MDEPVSDQSAQSQKDETNKPGLEGLQPEVDEPEAPLTGDADGLENGFIDNPEPVVAHLDEDQTNSGNQLEDENPDLLLSETLDPIFVENFETESPSGVVDDNVDDDVVDDDCWFDSFVCFQNQVVLFLVLFLGTAWLLIYART